MRIITKIQGGIIKYYKKLFLTTVFLLTLTSFRCKGEAYPGITVSPNSLSSTLSHGETSRQWIIIFNKGGSYLSFDISIEGEENSMQVLEFDGVDDYVEVPDHPSLSAIGGFFTLECWMNIEKDPFRAREILGKWGIGGSYNDEYGLDFPTRGILELTISGTSGGMTEIRSNKIPPYTWTHFAGVFDSASVSYKLFINGILETSMTPSTITMNRDTDEPFRMGTYDFYFHPNFKGHLDEVRIWNVARTQEEIQVDMHRELGGNEPGLVGYWKFNEGSGDTAYDSSSNNNDGTLHGGVTRGVGWLSINTTSGALPAGDGVVVEVTFDPTVLDAGDYNSNLIISSTDPDEPKTIIPVHLTVR
jgi:hypothetical protein